MFSVNRAVSISYVTFPNSPYVEKFRVMGVFIIVEYLEVGLSYFCNLFSIISDRLKAFRIWHFEIFTSNQNILPLFYIATRVTK